MGVSCSWLAGLFASGMVVWRGLVGYERSWGGNAGLIAVPGFCELLLIVLLPCLESNRLGKTLGGGKVYDGLRKGLF